MYMITYVANREKAALKAPIIAPAQTAWGGGDICWLAHDEAAQFPIAHIPQDFWPIWEDMQKQHIDIVLTRANNRRKMLLVADMDSTMIRQECIDELAIEAGIGEQVQAITAKAMDGTLDFHQALCARVKLFKNAPCGLIDTVLEHKLDLMAGGKTLVATMKANGAHTALISGGFTQFAKDIARKLGFDQYHANTLLHKNGVLTGEVANPILGRDSKVRIMGDIAADLGVTLQNVIAVGDGANDVDMLQKAGFGVALHAKPSVQRQCNKRINHGDLTALLYIQGYQKTDFVG